VKALWRPRIGRVAVVAIALLALGVAAVLWQRTQAFDAHAANDFEAALREMRRLDSVLTQEVLRARFRLVNSYDPLTRTMASMAVLEPVVERPPPHLDGEASAAVRASSTSYTTIAHDKRNLIETFKSTNSVLQNSLRYLPTIATQIADRADAMPQGSVLAGRVRRLLESVLVYSLTSDEELVPAIAQQLDGLLADRPSYPDELRGLKLDALAIHTRSVLRSKPAVDALVRRIAEAPTSARAEDVLGAYVAGHERADDRVRRLDEVIYALSVMLLGLVVHVFVRLRRSTRALSRANATLESKVEKRTRTLDEANREMRLVLDNVEQGLLTLDLQGRVVGERSAVVDEWIPNAGERPLWEALAPLDSEKAAFLQLGWEAIVEGFLPLEVLIHQLPRSFVANGRHFVLEYRPILVAGELRKMLVVLTDVTTKLAGQRAEAEQREVLNAFECVMRDRSGFLEFCSEAQSIVDRVCGPGADRLVTLRDVHTLKGTAALFQVVGVVGACHAIETDLGEPNSELTVAHRHALLSAWTSFRQKVAPFLGALDTSGLQISRADFDSLRLAVANGVGVQPLLTVLAGLENEPGEQRLARVADQARALAERLGKRNVTVTAECKGVRFDPRRWAPLWSAFVHVMRNAVDHGIEMPEERARAGKAGAGSLSLRAYETDGYQVVEIEDDGRGVDWTAVAEKARNMGLPDATKEDLLAALFHGGLSTKSSITELSGRGVGVSAVHRACVAMGGEVRLSSENGHGTRTGCWIPIAAPATPAGLG
jgi:HPt (histidine-containing phosphotransfer) domain-containing protein